MKKLALSVAAAATLLCGSAFAQVDIGIALGANNSDFDCSGVASCSTKSIGYKLSGGYRLSPNVSAEIVYFGLGDVMQGRVPRNGSFFKVSVEGSGLGLGLAMRKHFTKKWRGVARIGVASNQTKVSVEGVKSTGERFVSTDSETHPSIYGGFGLSYAFERNITADATIDFTRVKLGYESAKVRMMSAGLTYAF